MPLLRQPRSYYTAWSEYLAQDACDFVRLGLALWTFCQLHLSSATWRSTEGWDATRHAALSPHSNICTALIMHFPGSSCTSECISNDALPSPLIPKYPVRILYVLATSLEGCCGFDGGCMAIGQIAGLWRMVQCSQHTFPYHGQRSPGTDVI